MPLLKVEGGGGVGNVVYHFILGENYTLYLSGWKRSTTELKCTWPVILTSDCLKVISSPGK